MYPSLNIYTTSSRIFFIQNIIILSLRELRIDNSSTITYKRN